MELLPTQAREMGEGSVLLREPLRLASGGAEGLTEEEVTLN